MKVYATILMHYKHFYIDSIKKPTHLNIIVKLKNIQTPSNISIHLQKTRPRITW